MPFVCFLCMYSSMHVGVCLCVFMHCSVSVLRPNGCTFRRPFHHVGRGEIVKDHDVKFFL